MVVEKGLSDRNEVQAGYKQTEVGVIPEDWTVSVIGNECKIFGRIGFRGYTVNDIVQEGKGAITLSPSNIQDNELDINKVTYISWFKYEESPEIKIYNGDILLVKTGSTFGKTAFVKELNEKATVNPQIVVLKNIACEAEFLGYVMKSPIIQNQINSFIVGGAIPTLSQEQVKKFTFPLPPLPEQTAIANALSDMDALIAQTEKLIEKKKAIKQGVMQELLKPKDGWVTVKIREIAKVGRGRVISQNEISKSLNKSFPVYSSQTSNNGVMGYIDTYDFEGEYITWTTDGEKAGTVFHRKGRFNCTNVCGTIKLKEGNPRFIHYVLAIEAPKHVSRNLANPKLMNEPMKNIEITIPDNVDVQNSISETIFEMEIEINLIETKLQKLKYHKQGMMQALLTGKIRLI